MKMAEALSIIHRKDQAGYMVNFAVKEGHLLHSDSFPDKHAGEALIPTEAEAWDLAKAFAEKTEGRCVDIYVVNAQFIPVKDYSKKRLNPSYGL